jgi:hypothetical protein
MRNKRQTHLFQHYINATADTLRRLSLNRQLSCHHLMLERVILSSRYLMLKQCIHAAGASLKRCPQQYGRKENYAMMDKGHETGQIFPFLLSVAFHRDPSWWWMCDLAERF